MKANSPKWWTWVLIPTLIFVGIGLRFSGLSFASIDIEDFLLNWYDRLALDGFVALREPFSNYTPPYLYLLFLMTKTANFIPKIAAIKLLSICFDFLNVFLVYKILKIRYPQGVTALTGAALFLVLPTILLNSSYWGQSDAIYTFFLLACVFFLMKDQSLIAVIFLGVAFSFKAQAAFLGPLLLLLIVKKKIPWFYLGIVPLVYGLMMIPAALTGRSMIELLTIYVNQTGFYQTLSEHAPNLYLFIPNSLYGPVLVIGLLMTALVALTWTTMYALKLKEFTPQTILLCSLVSVAFMPFFLPKMHDRYFYLAEVFSFLVAFYFPGMWLVALGYQIVSGLVYSVVLRANVTQVEPALAGSILILAAFLNTALIGYVFWKQWKLTNSDGYVNSEQ
jgi:Gpi18-like mannosyltransferase